VVAGDHPEIIPVIFGQNSMAVLEEMCKKL